MRSLWHRLRWLGRERRAEADLGDEVGFHLAMLEKEFRERGMPAEAARVAALREFGGVTRTKEAYRERRGFPRLQEAARDFRYALRGLRRNPGFAAAAILSLALGIGANTAIFSLFHTLLMRRLPVANPDQLVLMFRTGAWGRGFSSYPLYLEIQKRSDLFEGVLARSGADKVRFGAAGELMETAWREFVSGNYFSVLGVQPAAGRLFTDDDNRIPKGHPLAVLSYEFWQRRFGGDRNVIGQAVLLDAKPFTVIGVAARGFRGVGLDRTSELWLPAMMQPGDLSQPGRFWAWIVGRRRTDVSRERVQAAIDVLFEQHRTAVWGNHANAAFRRTGMAQKIEVQDAGIGISMLREQFAAPLRVLMGAVLLVLLAACANVANLLLARNAAREKEIALRFSLGATRARLIRQALAETLLLASCGAALGIGIAYAGQEAILRFLPGLSSTPFRNSPPGSALVFSLVLTGLAALLFGVGPAIRSTAVDPARGLRPGSGRPNGWQPTLRRVLVTAQVAFSVVLVALAGLFSHSLAELRRVDLGFRDQSLLMFALDFPNWWKPEAQHAAYERFLGRMKELPGVSLVSYGFPGPFRSGSSSSSIRVPGSAVTAQETAWVNVQQIAPHYFEALGIPPMVGQEFEPQDAGKPMALVNQAFVKRFLAGEANPMQRVIVFDESKPATRITGIVRDIPHFALRVPPVPTIYLPYERNLSEGPEILLRAASENGLIPALRREAEKLGPQVTVTEPKTIRQQVDESIFEDRLLASLGGFFGGLALLLAGIGLYGVVAYGTVRRTGEIGLRIALGARRSSVLRLVLGDAFLLVGAGLAIGLPFAVLAARAARTLLFGIEPLDAPAFLATAVVLLAAGGAAAALPARRAATIDPAHVLRHE